MHLASNTISSDFFLGGLGIKNMPAVKETLVSSLGLEDSLEKKTVTLSGILAWDKNMDKFHGQRSLVWYGPWGGKKNRT